MSVFTQIEDSKIASLLREHSLGDLLLSEPVTSGIENTIYKVTSTKGVYILTLYEQGEVGEVCKVLNTVNVLASRGVPIPKPLPSGKDLASLFEGKVLTFIPFVEGVQLDDPPLESLESLGRQLAALHLAGEDLGEDLKNDLHTGVSIVGEARRWAELFPGWRELLIGEADFQEKIPEAELPGGFIHGDIFLDNAIFDKKSGGVRALLDFSFSGRGVFLFDLAILVLDGAFRENRIDRKRKDAILRGYGGVRKIGDDESGLLAAYMRRVALRYMCLRLERSLVKSVTGITKDPREMADKIMALRKL